MLFARICRACGRELVRGERFLCLHCEAGLPLWRGSTEELRSRRFPRTAPIAGVYPWLLYTNENPICTLIRRGKFDDRPELIENLSERYAQYLKKEGLINDIDAIVAVPMHWWKRLRRGYNQAELIGYTISEKSGVPFINALKAVRRHAVQSRKSAEERADNVRGIFSLRKNHGLAAGMKIAVVDDILTTGATLTEAIRALENAKPAGITVMTLAATGMHG